ncbi:diacylglycerol/lipid kinase family protein [Lacticaseibacillus zeae]|uniref:Diacylglycerol kinase family lipid kinase n=1 Tax=Lacticaseibacillus zeae subsp. silagei TaxID=3068307 RepID=A0ABD7ZCR4_LACZE|nr:MULTISPECIES: diacylglycerol kinase family protein [Lacticaseibacillus]MDE3315048.1 diacylglycerol kinase family lipid kinase [Lacticaseibacillus zeae]OFR95281.1 diacylglycerol kinase [Lactobacillus sp. HMSC068F07]WLV84829.1 diacylglycerol kinase family lipid kinase [Lacticaseibacillus sp. NCIMB 15475]WLV85380.1 diacylglycerol kinase family lipid kinase [Lacticaseibacillus sp. NCIMB 15474]
MAAVFYYLIYNPAAGGGAAIPIFKQVKAVLDQRQLPYAIKTSRYPGHTNVITKQIGNFNTHERPVLLVIGGDGTLNQAINGLIGTRQHDIPVAYVPAGSGNDFARGIGMSEDPMHALEQILQASNPVTIDIGRYHERTRDESGYFVNNIGIGFDAAVVNAANHSDSKQLLNKFHLGKLTYLFHVLGMLLTRRPFPVAVYEKGVRHFFHHAYICTTTNIPYFGGGVRLYKPADPTDGQLDLVIVEWFNIVSWALAMLQLLRGKTPTSKAVHLFHANKLTVETSSLEFGQMDGEEMGTRPFEIDFSVASQRFWIDRSI